MFRGLEIAGYDFAAEVYNGTYSFSRATGKWVFANGAYALVGANVLVAVSGQGVHLEAAATNLVKYLANLSEWTTSVVGTTATAEGGGTRLGLFDEPYTITATNTSGRLETKDADAFAVTSGTPVYLSYWYVEGTSGHARLTVRQVSGSPSNINGTIPNLESGATNAGEMDQITTTEVATGIYLTQCRWTPNFTGNALVGIGPQDAAGLTIIALGAQAEVNDWSSPVLSNGTQATRAADVLELIVPNGTYDAYFQTYESGHVWVENQAVTNGTFVVSPAAFESPLSLAYIYPYTATNEATVAAIVGTAYRTLTDQLLFDGIVFTPQTADNTYALKQDRYNPGTFRAEIHNGDEWAPDVGRVPMRERAEVRLSSDFEYDEDVWLKIRQTVYGTTPFVADHDEGFTHHHVMQWHCAEGVSGTSPILTYSLTDEGFWQVKTRGENVSGGSDAAFLVQYEDQHFELGREYELRLHVVFSPTAGVLEVWRDGIKIVDETGLAIGYPDDTIPYPKFGIYRTTTVGPLVVVTELVYLGRSDPG